MKTSKSPLPTLCLSMRLQREGNSEQRIKYEKKPQLSKSDACLSSNKCNKKLQPMKECPYNSRSEFYVPSNHLRESTKSSFMQKVVSTKMMCIKTLQNRLTDAHYHLNELATENKLLKTLQRRQDLALRKYEGTNAELPRIINTHHEELRILQSKYKNLKCQHRSNCELLKQKEVKILLIQDQNKHLLQLSKDRNLEERESLKLKLSDLNYKVEQQEKTIDTLNKKLAIETKYLKQQLHLEITKHKDTQKKLQETINRLKSTEELLENKEHKLVYKKQLNLSHTMQNTRRISHLNLENRLDSSDGENLNTSKVSLNDLENWKDSLNIRDVEKFIKQLNLFKQSNALNSTFTNSECPVIKMMECDEETNLSLENLGSNENNIVIHEQDAETETKCYNDNDNYVDCRRMDPEISLDNRTESPNLVETIDTSLPKLEKLHIKYSISEESEPESFTEVNEEMKDEILNTAHAENDLTENLRFKKKITYDKDRLLAVMRAIDDNEVLNM